MPKGGKFIMKLKGSKTEQNLMTAFVGESQARNKYTYFASKAREELLIFFSIEVYRFRYVCFPS